MFKKKPESLLYLRKTALQLYYGKEAEVSQLDFPRELVDDLEVVDQDGLRSLIREALSTSGLKPNKCLLVLDDTILFQKGVVADNEDAKVSQHQFFGSLPLSPDQTARLSIRDGDNCYFFATNKGFFGAVVEEFEELGWPVLGATPLVFFAQSGSREVLEKTEVRMILDNFEHSPHIDFLSDGRPTESQKSASVQGFLKTLLPTLGLFCLLMVVSLGSLKVFLNVRSGKGFLPIQFSLASPSPSPLPVPTPLPSPEPSFAPKQDLRVEVLNGTPVAGRAGKIKASLVKIGFTNIDTGNTSPTMGTAVRFSKKVAPKDKDEVLAEAKKAFPDASVEDLDLSDKDIFIIIGK